MRTVSRVLGLLALAAGTAADAADSLDTEAILREMEEVTDVEFDRDRIPTAP